MTGNGKTALRGGYGITYERLFYPVSGFYQSASNFALVSLTAGVGTGTIPLSTSPFGPLSGTTGTTILPTTLVRAIEPNIETPMIHNWSLSLERELFSNTVGAVQYAGAAGRNLFTMSNVNRPGTAAAFLGATDPIARLNPLYGPIFLLTSDGRSNYNAFIAELTNSSWRNIGLQLTARYRYVSERSMFQRKQRLRLRF